MIDVVNESGDAVDEAGVAEQARFVLDRLRIHPAADLSILFADVEAMTDLHVMWMDEPGPTDVMSFPMDELRVPRDDEEPTEGLLGDIVIARETVAAEAEAERLNHPAVVLVVAVVLVELGQLQRLVELVELGQSAGLVEQPMVVE